jgi:hypothetical protein
MDHTPAMRPAAGSGTGPVGTAAPGTRGGPRPPSGGNAGVSRRKRHARPGKRALPAGRKRQGLPGRKRAASRPQKCGIPAGNASHGGVNAADHHPPDGNAAGQRPSRRKAPAGWPNPPLNARQAAAGGACPDCPFFPADETVGAGPDGPHRGPSGGAGRADRAVHFQITNSEIANTCSQHRKRRLSIHLRASYPNEISCCR